MRRWQAPIDLTWESLLWASAGAPRERYDREKYNAGSQASAWERISAKLCFASPCDDFVLPGDATGSRASRMCVPKRSLGTRENKRNGERRRQPPRVRILRRKLGVLQGLYPSEG